MTDQFVDKNNQIPILGTSSRSFYICIFITPIKTLRQRLSALVSNSGATLLSHRPRWDKSSSNSIFGMPDRPKKPKNS